MEDFLFFADDDTNVQFYIQGPNESALSDSLRDISSSIHALYYQDGIIPENEEYRIILRAFADLLFFRLAADLRDISMD